jgi:VWFA-related protein
MRAHYWFASATLTVALAAVHPAAQPQSPDTFRSGRDVLSVNASVRDGSGRPLTDLQAADFVVRIDGQPRTVLTARMFGTDADRVTNGVVPIARFTRVTEASPGRVVVFAIDRTSIKAGAEKAAIETAAKMLDALSPADAVGAVGLPGGGIDVTRDHAAVTEAIRKMTGAAPASVWEHALSWDEALAFEREFRPTIAQVIARECREGQNDCPPELRRQAREMLLIGRGQADTMLSNLTRLLESLAPLSAPKHLVIISGGLPFDLDLLARYRALAAKAAQTHVALFVVHLDQAAFDASDRGHFARVFGGAEYADGLANIASSTGGVFFNGVGRATGVFDRIASDINYFYELGVESRPSDGDGKSHRVEVRVSRAGAQVRAPSETAIRPAVPRTGENAIQQALTQPTDVAELPLEAATYMMHSSDAEKVRVIVAAQLSAEAGVKPSDWGYVIMDGARVIAGKRIRLARETPDPWSATASVDVPPGRYRLRVAAVAADGRRGALDVPLRVGLRMAGTIQASDLMLGTIDGGQLQPRARVRQGGRVVGMIELSSSETLSATTGFLSVTRAGTTEPALRQPLILRTRADDKSVVIAEAAADLSSLTAGTYTASAVVEREGAQVARVSRVFEVVAGAAGADAGVAAPAPAAARAAPRDPMVNDVLQRVGRYVAGYGEQASVLIGVEHYEQRLLSMMKGQPTVRKLVADILLVRTSDELGWSGFRDVIEVDGKPVGERQNRLQALFKSGSPDAAEARRIADEGARYNIGPTRRNFNEPTSALFFLMPATQSRFQFTRKGEITLDGMQVMEIGFQEKTHPTLIRTSTGGDVTSEGSIWVVPSDGTVVRTKLAISGFAGLGSSSTIDVTYTRDSRLGLWVPAIMKERHTSNVQGLLSGMGPSASQGVVVVATATYEDFKRFEITSAIK